VLHSDIYPLVHGRLTIRPGDVTKASDKCKHQNLRGIKNGHRVDPDPSKDLNMRNHFKEELQHNVSNTSIIIT